VNKETNKNKEEKRRKTFQQIKKHEKRYIHVNPGHI